MSISTGVIKVGKSISTQISRGAKVATKVATKNKEITPDTVELATKKTNQATKEKSSNFFQRMYDDAKLLFSAAKFVKDMSRSIVIVQQKEPKTFMDKVINKIKFPYDFIKVIRNYISQFKKTNSDLIKQIPQKRKEAQEIIDSISDKTWNKMSNAIFKKSATTSTPFVKNLSGLKNYCKKNNIELPEDVAKALQILSRRGKVFSQKMNEALSKGLNPQNQDKYTQKFVKINQKEFDLIKNFIEQLPPQDKTKFKLLYNFESMSSKVLYDERIYKASNNVVKRNQTFYHGTKAQNEILEKGFSTQSGQPFFAREIGEAVYLTPRKKVASFFAGIRGAILKLRVNTKNVAAINDAQQTKIVLEILENSGLKSSDLANPFVKELIMKNLFTRNGYNAVYSSRALTPNIGGCSPLQWFVRSNQTMVNALTGGKQSQLAVFDPKDITILKKTTGEKIKDTTMQATTLVKKPFIVFSSIKDGIKKLKNLFESATN